MTATEIVQILSGLRLPLGVETDAQAAIEAEFKRCGIAYEREARLSAADRPDFMVGAVATEVKIKGSKRKIWGQLQRYAQHDAVEELVLVTNVPMGVPAEINGKPVYVVNMARAWM